MEIPRQRPNSAARLEIPQPAENCGPYSLQQVFIKVLPAREINKNTITTFDYIYGTIYCYKQQSKNVSHDTSLK